MIKSQKGVMGSAGMENCQLLGKSLYWNAILKYILEIFTFTS